MSKLCHIGKMPNEILARIVKHLRNFDLIACRCVNRQISAVATRELARKNFRTLSVVFSTRSLQTLANICAHPDLGAYVCRIWFSPFRTRPKSISKLANIFEQNLEFGDQQDLDEAYRNLQSYTQISYDEHNLDESGQGVQLLTEALTSLHNRGISVDIFMDNDSDNHGIGSNGTFRETFTDDLESIADDYTNEHMNIIFQALLHSGCQVNTFDIYQCSFGCSVENLVDLTDSVEPALEAFAMLKNLDLLLVERLEQKTLDSLGSVLGQLRHLEVLSLGLSWNPDRQSKEGVSASSSADRAYDTILCSLKSSSLQQVNLRNMGISEKRLIAMLSASKGSLKNLDLDCICLINGCWNRFFSWLCNNLQLDHLKLFSLSNSKAIYHDVYNWKKERLGRYGLKFHGKEDVRSGLSELLSEGTGPVADQ